ncbi:hypothetical protein SAMN04488506_0419 [Desemzia incerta]|uniref:Camelysin metallo-endopeptidase n=1 Tax=Desemzia incerta TaxID=82801 RepID=A0A1I5VAA8_9LACT|nr:hypothetical protein [Desemzia incerta]SFQ03876.1 hypothetical protein SAMN04488506_0419 [Desemzia incerta]
MKNIKKFYPLIVGLVLLISVAAYGTRAYFSDSTSEDAGINLTLGNVDITARSGDWIYIPDVENEQLTASGTTSIGETIKDKNNFGKEDNIAKGVVLKNARPGDAFKKTFTFENTGSLDQVLTFDSKDNKTDGIFVVSWEKTGLDESESIILAPKEEFTATMTVTVDLTNAEQEYNEVTAKHVDSNNFVGKTVEVKTKQTNVTAAE